MNKFIKVLFSLFLIICLFGCHKANIDKTHTINYKEIEIANIQNDSILFEKCLNLYQKNMKNAKEKEQKHVVALKYLEDSYKVASNRVNLDLEILDVFSNEYMDYIATLQAYCEIYLKERSELVKEETLTDINKISQVNSGVALKQIKNVIDNFK